VAKELQPTAEREKEEGFILLVGPLPQIIEGVGDRDRAMKTAVKILEENDTVVFVSKVLSRIGNARVLKNQLIFARKN